MGDPTKTIHGLSLKQGINKAPSGESWELYNKGYRFIKPSMTKSPEMHAHVFKIFNNMPKMLKAMKDLNECQKPIQVRGKTVSSGRDCGNLEYRIDAHVQEIIDKAENDYPDIWWAGKIRETVRPITTPEPTPTAPVVSISTDKSWSKYAILGIGVVIFLVVLRRRA